MGSGRGGGTKSVRRGVSHDLMSSGETETAEGQGKEKRVA